MTRFVPVKEFAHMCLALPRHDRWIDELTWIPVSETEIHLASRYYPIAIRIEDQKPRLGLIVGRRYLAHPLLDSAGIWRGAYRPVGLRCFPFESPDIGDSPLSDILIDADSEYLSSTSGIPIVDETGRPNQTLIEVHRLFHLLRRAQDSFAAILDQYLIGGLLVPLSDDGATDADLDRSLYVINPVRFSQTDGIALAAMARNQFLSVDVAIACQFSLQNLRPEYRPKDAGRPDLHMAGPMSPLMDTTMIDDLSLALDDGELISISDFGS